MTDERDEFIERVRAVLREPPTVDPSARARLLVAVAAERERRASMPHGRRWERRLFVATGLAAALLVGWFMWPTREHDRAGGLQTATSPTAHPSAATPAVLAGALPDADAARRVQFVFRDPAAHRVSVVGDFTQWDARQAIMTRDSASGLWSVTLALHPGRHVYAFLVDDSVWVQDPRAVEAPDADFGRPGSVLLVGQP